MVGMVVRAKPRRGWIFCTLCQCIYLQELNHHISYPPTPVHLTLLLSLFHQALDGKEDFLHAKTTFATAPSLIVLCELSSFFAEDPEAT